MALFKKKKTETLSYDPKQKEPVIRCSICTGEQTAGFRVVKDGKFEDVMLIRGAQDLAEFKQKYGITGDVPHIY